MKKILLLLLSLPPILLIIYYVHLYLVDYFEVADTALATKFYLFITGVTILVITNLLLTYFLKHKYIGFVFLAWSMIKIMLVMGFFLAFVLKKKIAVSNNTIYDFVIIYMLYLFYEIIFATQLLSIKKYG